MYPSFMQISWNSLIGFLIWHISAEINYEFMQEIDTFMEEKKMKELNSGSSQRFFGYIFFFHSARTIILFELEDNFLKVQE